jgi:hypothetical protein
MKFVITYIAVCLLMLANSCNPNEQKPRIEGGDSTPQYEELSQLLRKVNARRIIKGNLPDTLFSKMKDFEKWQYSFSSVEHYDTMFTIFFDVKHEGEFIDYPSWFPVYSGVTFSKEDSTILYLQAYKSSFFYEFHEDDKPTTIKEVVPTWELNK